MTQLLNPHSPANQQVFLAHHQVSLYYDEDLGWGLAWKHGFMGMISLRTKSDACAIAALFVHWWLNLQSGLDPGELIQAAWFFFNPQAVGEAKAQHTDPDSAKMFDFVEEQLAFYKISSST